MTDAPLWDQWNSGGGPRYPHGKAVQFLLRRFPRRPDRPDRAGLQVLDFGCGSGVHTVFLAAEGFAAHGIDISPVGIANTQAWLDRAGGRAALTVGSVTATPYPDAAFDALISIGVLECLDAAGFAAAMAETVRLLKPGAAALLLFAAETDFRITEQKVPGLRGLTTAEVEAALHPLRGLLAQVWLDRYTTTYENRRICQDEHLVTLVRGGA